MEAITGLLEGLDLTKLVPDLAGLLGKVRTLSVLALLIGPVIMLILGLLYLFLPPREANWKFGYRTYFGMGSVEAWQFTQKIAGLVYGGLGLMLTVIMGILCLTFGGKEAIAIAALTAKCLIWELALALIAWLAIGITATVFFDRDGMRRR